MKKLTAILMAFSILTARFTCFAGENKPVNENIGEEITSTEKTDETAVTKAKENKKAAKTEKEEKVKQSEKADETDKEKQEKSRINKELLEQKKAERKEAKLEASAYINEIKEIFKDSDAETRKEILAEIAETKKELKDYSIGVFIKSIAVDFDKYDAVKPIIENERLLVPLRAVSETYGAEVTWIEDGEIQSIIIAKDSIKITMQIDSKTAFINDKEVQLDTAPRIIKDRTLVPIRFISEAFGLNVEWDDDSQTVIID